MNSRGVLLAALALQACSLAPPYQRPATVAEPETYRESRGWVIARPADSTPRGAWWEQFKDQDLNKLEIQASAANPDIQAALARLQQARSLARASNASLYPSVSANVSSTNNQYSTNRPFFPQGASPKFDDNVAGIDVNYELDLWGQLRNAANASAALASASAADLATLELSTHAELAMDYFTLRGYDAGQATLDATVTAYTMALELTQSLYAGGAASAVDVSLAQLLLQNALTQATDSRLKRSQMEHAIAVLVGASASTFTIAELKDFKSDIPLIDPGLPSTLLLRRPDIASAERHVAAANANIGVARAAFFPVFSLNAAVGYESTTPSNWIKAPSLFWSVGPAAAFSLFDAGLRQSMTDQAHAAYDEAAANYRHSVLTAYQEVEDDLVALKQLAREGQSVAAANDAAQQALAQANYRYQGGIASYLDVVVAQSAALQTQLANVNIQVRRLNTSVLLVKALGGGWQTKDQDAAAPEQPRVDAAEQNK